MTDRDFSLKVTYSIKKSSFMKSMKPLLHVSDFNNDWNRRALDLAWQERTSILRGPDIAKGSPGQLSEPSLPAKPEPPKHSDVKQ